MSADIKKPKGVRKAWASDDMQAAIDAAVAKHALQRKVLPGKLPKCCESGAPEADGRGRNLTGNPCSPVQ